MEHQLPRLPYAKDALYPYISPETIDYHYGIHHKTYVDNLNKFIKGTEFEKKSLEDIVKTAPSGPIFNNAAQVFNHTFYWESLMSGRDTLPSGKIAELVRSTYGSVEDFKKAFNEKAVANFGSGWTWLVQKKDGGLDIVNTSNAANPMTDDLKPLLTCDVWEHAYYIDYRNRRADYLSGFWHIVNWTAVGNRLG